MKEESNEKGLSSLARTLNLDGVVFIGRTFSEYLRMFNLEPSQLRIKVDLNYQLSKAFINSLMLFSSDQFRCQIL
jgi:hypothetical protein